MTESQPGLSQRIARLEEILHRLEREDLELETALALFEDGVTSLREAEKLLRVAELRVERLLEGPHGELRTQPLEGAE